MDSNPILIAVVALLALPGVTSLAVAGIRSVSDALNIDPRGVVWLVSALVTVVIMASGTAEALPSFTGDPVSFVAAWLAWLTVNARAAEGVYDVLLSKLPGLRPA